MGAIAAAGPQMIQNIQAGQPLTANIDPGQVARAAAVGAVAGGVAGLTFGIGTAAFGTGFAGTVGAGALSGAASGQAARATDNVASGRAITTGLGDPVDLATDAAIGATFAGAAHGVGRGLQALRARSVSNPVPGRLARVIDAEYLDPAHGYLGRPSDTHVFVTAADDIANVRTSHELARRLTLVDNAGNHRSGPFAVYEFNTPRHGIASPVFRSYPGFVGGGRTGGGAREFIIPNSPVSNLTRLIYRILQ